LPSKPGSSRAHGIGNIRKGLPDLMTAHLVIC
jgi:hypothetical protein